MNQKRETLKKVAGVSAVVALAPTSWTKPVLNSVILPVHAQTSTDTTAPMGEDVSFTADATGSASGTLTVSDDTDTNPTVVIVSQPSAGAVSLSGTTFEYVATDGASFANSDSFTYRVVDEAGNESPVFTVTINSGVNQAPIISINFPPLTLGVEVGTGNTIDLTSFVNPPIAGADVTIVGIGDDISFVFAELSGNNIDSNAVFEITTIGDLMLNTGVGFILRGSQIFFQGGVISSQTATITASVTNLDGATDSATFVVGINTGA